MNFRILRAMLEKDARSLLPLVALTALLFLVDALVVRLDLLRLWSTWDTSVLLVAFVVLILSVFQLDSAASLTEDWLCRPVRRRELLGSKLLLLLGATYLPRAIGTFLADVILGRTLTESLLDAVMLPDRLSLLVYLLPLTMFVAIVTRTFVQSFGVLFAIFIGVIVVPTPFVRPPGPLDPGIRDALLAAGMGWVATVPVMLASMALVVLGFWLVYWRRNLALARGLMAITVLVSVFLLVLPMAFLPWKSTFTLQATAGPARPAEAARIHLRNARACFPATRRADQSANAAFVAASSGYAKWDDEALQDAGPDSVAFLTAIEPRGLPDGWRVKLNHVQADYSAADAPLVSLRPAHYITDDHGGERLAHAWMLPERTLQKLRGAEPRLTLGYSLALLKPRHQALPTDGERYALPGLGWCSARVDEPVNRIDVDCFSVLRHPAQISAQLNDIDASRVYGPIDFAPQWVQWPYSHRVELAIGAARLAKHATITVTAWEAAGFIDKGLTMPGILGGTAEDCPLPAKGGTSFQQARWRDAAPHEPVSVTVDEGVQLEVLDFGGAGSPIVLLPGLGATAHSFDDLAPLLAQRHRVIAMTRRGTSASSRPDFGYDTPRLGQDVLRVMDAMGLRKAVLVGHSIAGDELTWLGGHHPERFDALVYLDAAYDRSGDAHGAAASRQRELNRALPPEPPFPPQALQSYQAMLKTLSARGHSRYPEGELIAFLHMNDAFLAGTPGIDARTQQAIKAAIEAPDYSALKIPALAIYAFADPGKPLPPWYDPADRKVMDSLAELARLGEEVKRSNLERFSREVENGQVLEMRNATHYIFQSNQREVLESIENFLASTPAAR